MAGKWPKIRARQHHRGLAVDEHHRARGRVRARRAAAALSRGRAGRLRLDRRAHPVRAISAGAAVSPDDRSVHLGTAVRDWSIPARIRPKAAAANSWRRPGFAARSIHRLGDSSPCTGRLNNRIHSFFVETGERVAEPEPGHDRRTVTARELVRMIRGRRVRLAASHRLADARRSCTASSICRASRVRERVAGRPFGPHARKRAARSGEARVSRLHRHLPVARDAVESARERGTGRMTRDIAPSIARKPGHRRRSERDAFVMQPHRARPAASAATSGSSSAP